MLALCLSTPENQIAMALALGSGDPHIFNAWWFEQGYSTLLPSLQHHPEYFSYREEEQSELAALLIQFRATVRGVPLKYDSRTTVFGGGSTQVIHAILLTLARRQATPLRVGMVAPYYMLMKELVEITPGLVFTETPEEMDVEIVVAPNNPTGTKAGPSSSCAKYVIYDHAYDWPTYTETLSDDTQEAISVFTASKLFGVGGFRVGWAHLQDPTLGAAVQHTLELMGICPNSFGLLQLGHIVSLMLQQRLYREFFRMHRAKVQARRAQVQRLVTVVNTDGPYAWVYHPENVVTYLRERGIEVRPGSIFGATDQYGRLSLIDEDRTYRILEALWGAQK